MLRLGTPSVLVVFLWSISVTGQELSLGDTPAVGGIIANLGQIPHAVVVLSKHGKCTGALIHSSWVLTAGHCVSDHRGKPVGSKDLEVIGGVVDYKELGPTAQKRTGVQILIHPEYGHGQLGKHDIALVKVEPFELNKFVSAIKFSQKEWPQDRRMLNRSCVSAGWGMLAGRQVTSVLHLQKTIAKHGEKSCSCVPKNYINKRVVCLAAESTVGICFGDSGGALVCDDEIVGVAHMVMDKRSCSYFKAPESTIRCESQYVFGIYMYTCPYLNWIKQYVPGITTTPPSCKAPKISSLLNSSWFLILIIIVSYF